MISAVRRNPNPTNFLSFLIILARRIATSNLTHLLTLIKLYGGNYWSISGDDKKCFVPIGSPVQIGGKLPRPKDHFGGQQLQRSILTICKTVLICFSLLFLTNAAQANNIPGCESNIHLDAPNVPQPSGQDTVPPKITYPTAILKFSPSTIDDWQYSISLPENATTHAEVLEREPWHLPVDQLYIIDGVVGMNNKVYLVFGSQIQAVSTVGGTYSGPGQHNHAIAVATDSPIRVTYKNQTYEFTVNSFIVLGKHITCPVLKKTTAPSSLSYKIDSLTTPVNSFVHIDPPINQGGVVTNYSVEPALPVGLTLFQDSGLIRGVPTAVTPQTNYTITAKNSGGSTTTTLSISIESDDSSGPRLVSIERKSPNTETTDANTLTWRITFDEPVSSVDVGDFSVAGTTAAVSNVKPVSTSVFDVTVSGGDLVDLNATVTLTATTDGGIVDASNNAFVNTTPIGANNNTFVVGNDTSGPTVSITDVPTTLTNTNPFTATYTFNEDVGSTFTIDDVSAVLTNATASSFTTKTANSKFTVVITPDGSGDVSVGINAGAVEDAAGNKNATATPVVAKNNIVEETQKLLSDFIQNRRLTLANIQPNIGGFIDGTGFSGGGGPLGNLNLNSINTNSFNLSFTSSLGRIWEEMERNERNALSLRMSPQARQQSYGLSGLSVTHGDVASLDTYDHTTGVEMDKNLTPAQRRGYDMWVQLYGAYSEAGDSESTIWVGYVGGHKHISPNLLIGAFGQLDWSDESNSANGTSGDGMGWMIGPYMAAKLPDQNLYFDARAAWGRSNNDITQTSSTGSFDTERWLISGKVSGMFKADKITIRPAVSVSYYVETQEAFTDSLGNPIGEQTFTQGEVRFGPTFSVDHKLDDGTTLRPHFGASGVWNFAVDNGASSQGAVLGTGDFRARLDAGFTAITANGWSLNMNGFYDGIGIGNFFSYGGRARVTVPIQ